MVGITGEARAYGWSVVPDIKPPSGAKRELWGIPLWAYGIGVGAFVIAVYIFFRQTRSSSAGSTDAQQTASVANAPAGATSPTVYPFFMGQTPDTTSTSVTPSQQFGKVIGDIGGGYIHTEASPSSPTLGFWTGQPLNITGPSVTGVPYGGSSSPGLQGVSSNQWIPVNYAGTTGYLWGPEAQVSSAGMGGGGEPANTATGRINSMTAVAAPYVF